MLFFFDCETTGFPRWSDRSADPRQPHVCELAGILCYDNGDELASFDFIVRPEGWEIDETGGAFKAHGITNEMANTFGVPAFAVMKLFDRFANLANIWICHNPKFDTRMMRIMYAQLEEPWLKDKMEADGRAPVLVDTAEITKDLVKEAPTNRMMATGRKEHKTPKLGEAMAALFPEIPFRGHRAGEDVAACKRLYFRAKGGGPTSPAAAPKGDVLAEQPIGTQNVLEGL